MTVSAQQISTEIDLMNTLDENQIIAPTRPVNVLIEEAETLKHWSKTDLTKLIEAGLSEALIESLPVRIAICREAQAKWLVSMKTPNEAQKTWKVQKTAALELRRQLLHDFKYAFRENRRLLQTLKEIKKGNTEANLIQCAFLRSRTPSLVLLGHLFLFYSDSLKA